MSFDLKSISKTRRVRAPKVVIVGTGKIGKTTFAAMAPNAIGILTEDGADAVDAQAFPLARKAMSWSTAWIFIPPFFRWPGSRNPKGKTSTVRI